MILWDSLGPCRIVVLEPMSLVKDWLFAEK